ncbi:alpha/beta hydrolase family protein [Arthrospiribacter ruber]|uniref:Alpha/beta fold hydrolase n=1 Tax=Arthrospiribacter ruber TaxID=2487934 RepID=A0A951MAL7_9BACT|nr:alpha/beta fold hydrolase [Arthrospiribacter ruber]MBW3468071.1 alpha/beta fold hydrolase [Arthrospiribacter ruber]
MKYLFFLSITFLFCVQPLKSQELEGSWEGTLDVMGNKLPLIFRFEQSDEQWKGFMDSPSQGARNIALTKVLVVGNMLTFEHLAGGILYEGILMGDMVNGTFKQSGMSFPLNLNKMQEMEKASESRIRSQTPEAPFPYAEREIEFASETDNVKLKGTLTIPEGNGPFPGVILVTGSGPQDRNSTIFEHEPFWVIADYLSRNGIVVLRFDERGVGGSEGDFGSATSRDFKLDAQSGMKYLQDLQEVDISEIGMLGHSEGGMIAWMVAAEKENSSVDFVISLAGPVVSIPQLMAKQTEDISRSTGNSEELVASQVALNTKFYELIKKYGEVEKIKEMVPELVKEVLDTHELPEEIKAQQAASLTSTLTSSLNPWLVYFIQYEPESDINKIQIPTMAAFGGKDIQVNAAQNANKLISLFEGKEELLRLKVYDDLNHLFQKAETGSISEYIEIEETFNEQVLRDILDFILEISK